MLWGCFNVSGDGNLIIETGFVKILNKNLKHSAATLGLSRSSVFQQDNNPKHTSLLVKNCLLKTKVKVIDWPVKALT